MSTPYTDFGTRLGNLTISGVQSVNATPPENLVPGDMPAMWVQSLTGTEGPVTTKTHGFWPTLEATLIVAVNATQLGTHADNYNNTLTMLDSVRTALVSTVLHDPGGSNTANLSKGPLNWTLRYEFLPVGDTTYWAVIAEVTGQGI